MIFLVVGKIPKVGLSKTRLAVDIGGELAKETYRCMMEDFFSRLERTFPQAKLYFFYTPATEEVRKYFSSFFTNYKFESILYPQPEVPFFTRLVRGVELIRELEGDVDVHITGTDIPDFPFDFIKPKELKSEVTIGPDKDGGFYYCRLNAKNAAFLDIDTFVKDGDQSVFQVLKNHVEKAREVTVTLLPCWQDIDTLEDLEAFKKRAGEDHYQYKTLKKLDHVGKR